MSLTLDERQTIWDTFCRTLTSDPNPTVRAKAAEALGKLENDRSTPVLLQALSDESPIVRHTVIQSLGRIRATEAISALIATLTDQNPEISAAATIALGQIGAEAAIPALIQALNAPDPIVRKGSAKALGQIGSTRSISALLAALETDHDSMAIDAIVDALAAIASKDPNSIAQIQNTARQTIERSTNSQLRQSAVILLGKVAIADAVPYLIELTEDPDLNVVQAAIEALGDAAA